MDMHSFQDVTNIQIDILIAILVGVGPGGEVTDTASIALSIVWEKNPASSPAK